MILAYSNRRQVLGHRREDLVSFAFGNVLMRLGICCQDNWQRDEVQVILDWPEGANRRPFVNEYYTGWRHGRSGEPPGAVPYRCGPLSSLGFRGGLVFGITDTDERLQLADLVVGTGRSFVNYCMDRIPATDFGVQRFLALSPIFDQGDNRIFGRGITVAPANSDFLGLLLRRFHELGRTGGT